MEYTTNSKYKDLVPTAAASRMRSKGVRILLEQLYDKYLLLACAEINLAVENGDLSARLIIHETNVPKFVINDVSNLVSFYLLEKGYGCTVSESFLSAGEDSDVYEVYGKELAITF